MSNGVIENHNIFKLFKCIMMYKYNNTNNNKMPHLINGHIRFIEEDSMMNDFQKHVSEKYDSFSYNELVELLGIEKRQLETMNYEEIIKLFDTKQNIKTSLINALSIITAIAKKEGYALNELL